MLGNETASLAVDAGAGADAAGPRSDAGGLDATPPEAGCTAVHVSPAGDDQNTGCSPLAPRRTIASSVAYASAFSVPRVEICSGEYVEYILLEAPVSLYGGYECSTFARSALDETALTTVVRAPATNPNGRLATLTVQGQTVGRDVRVEGVRIVGADETERESIAVLVRAGAQVTIERVAAKSGITPTRAIGLWVDGAAPLVRHALLEGGGSTCEGSPALFGNAGALVATSPEAPGPRFEDNTMIGGGISCTGASPYSSIGLVLRSGTLTGENKLVRNVIEGYRADPSRPDGVSGSVAGVYSVASDVEIEDSSVFAGAFTAIAPTTAQPVTRYAWVDGVNAVGSGTLRIARSRLRGPEIRIEPNVRAGQVGGLTTHSRARVELTDSIAYSGDVLVTGGDAGAPVAGDDAGAPVAGDSLRGTFLHQSVQMLVSHTTFVVGKHAPGLLADALHLYNSQEKFVPEADLSHNLFVGGAGTMVRGLVVGKNAAQQATDVKIRSFVGNGFGPLALVAVRSGTPHPHLTSWNTALRQEGAITNDNVELLRSLSDGYACESSSCMRLTCTDCNEQLFDGYDPSDPVTFGARAMAEGPGFPLLPTAPCLFVSRLGGATGTDLLGVARTDLVSTVGAHEQRSSVCAAP